MNRPWHTWLVFGACAAVLLGALAWVSVATLRLDAGQRQAERQAEVEEGVRLALWRLDAAVSRLITEESVRPQAAWTSNLIPVAPVQLYFELRPNGRLTCPLVPEFPTRRAVVVSTNDAAWIYRGRLETLQNILNRQREPNALAAGALDTALNRDLLISTCSAVPQPPVPPVVAPALNLQQAGRGTPAGQALLNSSEWQARANAYGGLPQFASPGVNSTSPAGRTVFQNTLEPGPLQNLVSEGLMKPVWLERELVFARRVNFADGFAVQGCWLDWAALERSLVSTVADLFPRARLEPMPSRADGPDSRALASMPARFVPELPAVPARTGWTPVRVTLAVAWVAVLGAALAVGLLLHGTVSLSERRAAFVSAVTHELRTPLTTFKLYSEMLAGGMVADPERRQSYLATLCAEASRLGHLVENVLAYARLERGSARGRVERVELGQLLERVKPRLAQRVESAGIELVVDADAASLRTVVQVDVSVVEQVLFNLVDNACKYAAPASREKRLHLEALPEGRFAMLRVRDHGQGISAAGARRLFQPFCKSATEAAHSAPGVGLGLALCRRLMRGLGGELTLDRSVLDGACFVVSLPRG